MIKKILRAVIVAASLPDSGGAFYTRFMPEKKRITGVDNYKRKICRSISAELSMKAGDKIFIEGL